MIANLFVAARRTSDETHTTQQKGSYEEGSALLDRPFCGQIPVEFMSGKMGSGDSWDITLVRYYMSRDWVGQSPA
jgi:hypothetical protein